MCTNFEVVTHACMHHFDESRKPWRICEVCISNFKWNHLSQLQSTAKKCRKFAKYETMGELRSSSQCMHFQSICFVCMLQIFRRTILTNVFSVVSQQLIVCCLTCDSDLYLLYVDLRCCAYACLSLFSKRQLASMSVGGSFNRCELAFWTQTCRTSAWIKQQKFAVSL